MINDIVHHLDLEAVFWTRQNLHSSYSHNYVGNENVAKQSIST